MAAAHPLTDHDEIRNWAEARHEAATNGRPRGKADIVTGGATAPSLDERAQ